MPTAAIDTLLRSMVEQNASDLHLKTGKPPMVRIERLLTRMNEDPLGIEQLRELLYSILSEHQRAHLEKNLWVDLGYIVPELSRFRVTITYQRGHLLATFRRVPLVFPSLDEWGLPEVLKEFASLDNGLVLITGPAGSGKSSTLAALLRLVSETRRAHVVTIEDPIEFLIGDEMASVTQREVGTDTLNFADALRTVLRQDPDVIAIGEMRDLETMSTALSAAETGHTVFSTLHTISAAESIDRLVDAFPPRQQNQVRAQLARVLRGIVTLKLVPRQHEDGLIAAVEVLKNTPRISKLIATGAIAEIEPEMEDSVPLFRMQSMNQSLMALVLNGTISHEVAQEAATSTDDFDRELRKNLFPIQLENGGSDMSDSPADYSIIVQLQDARQLFEDSEERHSQELSERDHIISDLREKLEEREKSAQEALEAARQAREQVERVQKEQEEKVAELRARVKELSSPARTPKGFFARKP